MESEIRVSAQLGSREGFLPSLWTAAFLLSLYEAEREGEHAFWSLLKGTNPIMEPHLYNFIGN